MEKYLSYNFHAQSLYINRFAQKQQMMENSLFQAQYQQYDTARMLDAMYITNLQGSNAANVVTIQNTYILQIQLVECYCTTREAISFCFIITCPANSYIHNIQM